MASILSKVKYNSLRDRYFYIAKFVDQHRRLPSTKKMLFNDVLYRIQSGVEITSPERVFTTDKEFVKHYVAGVVGSQYHVPTLHVLRKQEDVDNYVFPDTCVVKPTHGCGEVIILKDGASPDREAMKQTMRQNYYYAHRERNYKQLKGKLIVEPLLFEGAHVHDYKVFCWNGRAKCIRYVNDRNQNYFRHFFDINWSLIPISIRPYVDDKPVPPIPDNFSEMIEIAEKLSNPFSFVRVDFYNNQGQLMVGEITHCHNGAGEKFSAIEDEITLSRVIWPEYWDGSN